MRGDNCCWPRLLGNLDFHLPLGRHLAREAVVDKKHRKGDILQWLSMRKGDGRKDRNMETI